MNDRYDVIIIGGGHAGTEAAWAAASALSSAGRDARVALVTMDPAKIGAMSCNPAIGGLAKGQMVREIDALGGLMGLAIDATGIMFKMLNTSKGPAVRGPRAQADKYAYAQKVQQLLARQPIIEIIAGTVDDLIVNRGQIQGVVVTTTDDPSPRLLHSQAVVLTTGTFMRGLMHTGERKTAGGRVDEGAAVGISGTLRSLGFELGRLKTGTPPRLAKESLDWDAMEPQHGDAEPTPFSDLTRTDAPPAASRFPMLEQIECRITHTTAAAHELIRDNLHRAPMYAGDIDAECGPRYCPSIEDKVVRFAQREAHHVFLEPESLHTNEIYCNGISTSLPIDVQEQLVHMMPGCEQARILKWGYAVEYDMVWPHQIDSTCMAMHIHGLFLAGQINCTTGYEEAGAQGLMAGCNAARIVLEQDPIRLRRDQGYIGVMLDDLVTRTPREPYRMFTSRAEHRLLLRADNSDERLTPLGRELGLVCDARWKVYQHRQASLQAIRTQFDTTFVQGKSLRDLARRPEVPVQTMASHLDKPFDAHLIERVMTESRYDGYIARQQAEIKRQVKAESQKIPTWFEPWTIAGLRSEAAEALKRFRPATMGQANRLPGINPADMTLLAVHLNRPKAAPDSQQKNSAPQPSTSGE
jgi:tRNA uridine 5-carboxymethylaminomethyl modification enzyme